MKALDLRPWLKHRMDMRATHKHRPGYAVRSGSRWWLWGLLGVAAVGSLAIWGSGELLPTDASGKRCQATWLEPVGGTGRVPSMIRGLPAQQMTEKRGPVVYAMPRPPELWVQHKDGAFGLRRVPVVQHIVDGTSASGLGSKQTMPDCKLERRPFAWIDSALAGPNRRLNDSLRPLLRREATRSAPTSPNR